MVFNDGLCGLGMALTWNMPIYKYLISNARSIVWSSNWNVKMGLVGCRDCIDYTSGPNLKGKWEMKFY
jgi:hypothetical protein